MRTMWLRNEVAALRTLLAGKVNGVVVGGPGSGASSILTAVAREFGATTIHVPTNPAVDDADGSGVAALIAALGVIGDGGLSARLSGLVDDEVPAAVLAASLMAEIRAEELSDDHLVVIDGADDLDPRSQQVVGALLRLLTGGRMRFAVSVREIGRNSPFIGVRRVELPVLSLRERTAMAHRMHSDLVPEVARLVAATSAGNLVALEHLLGSLTARQRTGMAPLVHPLRVGAETGVFAGHALDGISPRARGMLDVLALSPRTSIASLLAGSADAWATISELEAHGLVDTDESDIRMSDPLIRAIVHWSMSAQERTTLHAAQLERCTDTDAVSALWHSTFVEHRDDAAGRLMAVAVRFGMQGHGDEAVEFAERALYLGPDAASLASSLIELGEVLTMHGEFDFARRYARLARRSLRDAAIRIRGARLELEIEHLTGQGFSADYTGAWSAGDAVENPDGVAALLVTIGSVHAERFELGAAQENLAGALELHDRVGDRARSAIGALEILVAGYRGDGQPALTRYFSLVQGGAMPLELFEIMCVAQALILTEHYSEARSAIGMLEHAHSDPTIFHALGWEMLVELEARAGNVHRASIVFDEGAGTWAAMPIRPELESLLRYWRMLGTGGPLELEDTFDAIVRLSGTTRNRSLLARLGRLQGESLLMAGMPGEALRHLLRCDELVGGAELNPNILRHEPALIEALVRVGRREHAMLVLQRFRTRLESSPSRWGELAALRCDALVAPADRTIELFRRALRAFRPNDSAQEKARTAAWFGRRLQELGKTAEARDQLSSARALFLESGDHRAAELVLPDDERVEPRPTAENPLLAQLSENEREVVELVREGYRNRDIAEQVYVSLRTVEIRLTGVYRKLGVRSRTELIARLAEAGVPAAG